ncbi:MAG TPA: hypothetical protein VNT32_04810 [Thermoleophilaceae bacterium]|nr:hypothetical protein [Thermoleophilaceae bacterium]
MVPDVAASLALGLLAWLYLGPAAPDYDAMFALVWGDDVARGRSPQLDLPFVPAARPLTVLLGAALSPLGDSAAEALRLLVFLSLGAACVGLFRLGEELFGSLAGALAAAILFTRSEALALASQGFVDVPATALVVWAAVLEARRPARGLPVLTLLAAAALLRPEAFLLCGAYVLWLARARGAGALVRHGAFAALVPLSYLGGLALIAGEAVQDDSSTLAAVGSDSGLAEAAERMARGEWGLFGPPLVVAALAGGVIWLRRERREAALPLAVAALGVLAFLILGIAGEPTEPRYLLPTVSVMACLAAGAAFAHAFGRRLGAVALATAVLLAGAATVREATRLADLRGHVRLADSLQDDLRALVRSPPAREALEAGPGLRLPTSRPAPYLALWTGRRTSAFLGDGPSEPDANLLHPRTADAARSLVSGLPDSDAGGPPPPAPPEGAHVVAANESWLIFRMETDAP